LIVAILSAFIGAFTLYFSDRYARRSIETIFGLRLVDNRKN